MSTRIDFDIHSVFGRKIADLASVLADAKNKSANLKASFDSMAAGTTPSFGQIETEIGGMTTGSGETLYNILTSINTKLSSNTFDDIWKLYRG